jgi:hypothetical protein
MSSPARLGRAFVLYRPPSGKTLGRVGQSAGSCACACVCRRCRLALGAIRCPVHAQTGPKQQASLHEVTSWSLCCLSVCLSIIAIGIISARLLLWPRSPVTQFPNSPLTPCALRLSPHTSVGLALAAPLETGTGTDTPKAQLRTAQQHATHSMDTVTLDHGPPNIHYRHHLRQSPWSHDHHVWPPCPGRLIRNASPSTISSEARKIGLLLKASDGNLIQCVMLW